MRIKDVEKKERIRQSTLNLIFEEGIINLAINKISERAEVSSGTPYVYYNDKKDMLGQIYNDCYETVFGDLDNLINNGKDTKEDIHTSVRYLYNKLIEYPKECYYLESIQANIELVNKNKLINNAHVTKGVQKLYYKAVEEDILVTTDVLSLIALLYRPGIFYIARHNKAKIEDLEDIINISTDSIFK